MRRRSGNFLLPLVAGVASLIFGAMSLPTGLTLAGVGPVTEPGRHFPDGETPQTTQAPVPRAVCGPGSSPETGSVQGEVTVADRESGRSSQGYRCNMELVGHYGPDDPQGFEGAEWQMARYRDSRGVDCAFYSQRMAGIGMQGAPLQQQRRGTIVVDVSDPTDPKFARNLDTPGMLDPWETLKVNRERGLLAAVNVMGGMGIAFMGLYDIKDDCTNPTMLFDGPVSVLNHEGNFASDGRTYYSGGVEPGVISAVDVSDPTNPKLLTTFAAKLAIHGFSTSQDGTRLFIAHLNEDAFFVMGRSGRGDVKSMTGGGGLGIYDISEIQQRKPNPQVRLISGLEWADGQIGQHTLHVFKDGRPYVIYIDEYGHGGARIIDISDERKPTVVSKIKTEIMMPEHYERAKSQTVRPGKEDRGGDFCCWGGYNFHYCNVDTPVGPSMLACSANQQGLRLFDIQDFAHPKEIGYFNPGGDGTKQPGSFGGTYSGYLTAMPQFVPDRHEIWFTDQDRGFFAVRPTNGTWTSSATEATVSHGN